MKLLYTFLVFIFLLTTAQAQEITATLAGHATDDGFSVIDDNTNTLFRVRGDGNVGIGTDNPEDILHVVGGNMRIGEISDDDGSTASYGDRLYFSGGDDWPAWDSENSDPLWIARFNADDNESELRVGIGDDDWGNDKFVVGIESNGVWNPIMSVLGPGNVGIGTTTPDEKLHVAGNLRLNEAFEDKDGDAGTSGQILSSTVTGTDWIAAPGGGDFSNGGEVGGADRTLGNTDNYALSFKTNNTSRLKIQNDGGIRIDGNVGIFTDPGIASDINKSIQLYASGLYSNPYIKISGHNRAYIYLESRRTGTTSGKTWSIASGGGSISDLDKFSIYNADDGDCFTIRDGGNVGIQELLPGSRLVVKGAGNTSATSALNIKDIDDNSLFYIRDDGDLGIGTTNPQGALDVVSTTGAFIVPRMTTTQRIALTPVNGMIIYNTSDNQFNFYENGAWATK